jgi:hypothetical protein
MNSIPNTTSLKVRAARDYLRHGIIFMIYDPVAGVAYGREGEYTIEPCAAMEPCCSWMTPRHSN